MPAVKDVGESCEGEPHARFDGGREETNASRLIVARRPAPLAYPTATSKGRGRCVSLLTRADLKPRVPHRFLPKGCCRKFSRRLLHSKPDSIGPRLHSRSTFG